MDFEKIAIEINRTFDNKPIDLIKEYKWKRLTKNKLEEAKRINFLDKNDEIRIIGCKNSFAENELLKELFHQKINAIDDEKAKFYAHDWIISAWGGITNKKKEDLQKRIKSYISNINSNKNVNFEGIASTSKIGAFHYPNEHVIYDARVVFSLNWILLKSGSNIFFPIPSGRNSKMNAFDIDVLIRLHHKTQYEVSNEKPLSNKYISERDKEIYWDKNIAYWKLVELINNIKPHINFENSDHKKKSFYTEMLLFSMADKKIISEIIDKITIQINQ